MSMPLATMSTGVLSSSTSILSAGKRSASAGSAGSTHMRPNAMPVEIRTVPAGLSAACETSLTASSSRRSAALAFSMKRAPSSVTRELRVLRWTSRTPSCSSSRARLLLTAAGVRPRRRAAPARLPDAETSMRASSPCNCFMRRILNRKSP